MKEKRLESLLPLEVTSIEKILNIYLEQGFVRSPDIFGLNNFNTEDLKCNGFSKAGDHSFCLWEKWYRIATKNHHVNFKLYFREGKFETNGVGLAGASAVKILEKYASSYGNLNLIKKIKLYLDESGHYGSIIINDTIDLRFDKTRAHPTRGIFTLTGLSTDIGISKEFTEKKIDTGFAKNTKKYFKMTQARKKFFNNKGLIKLIDILAKNFPGACD